MRIVKKMEITLMIISVLLSITYNKSFALTKEQEQKAYDILEYMAAYEESLAPNGDATQITDNYIIKQIAEEYKKQCDAAGLSFEDVKKANPNYEYIIKDGRDTTEYRVWVATDQLYQDEKTGNTSSADEKEKARQSLLEKIENAATGDLTQKSVDELKEIDSWISEYQNTYGYADTSTSDFNTYRTNIQNEIDKRKASGTIESDYKTATDEKNDERNEELDSIKSDPMTGVLGDQTGSATHTPDEIINEGNDFLQAGTGVTTIDDNNLQSASKTLYNILLTIGIFLAVAVGVFLGAKFMFSTAEDKAKVKEALIPYIAGCVVVFSAFTIWKLAVTLLGGI